MRIKDTIYQEILDNRELRLRIAVALDISEPAVISAAKKKGASLQRYHAIEVLQQKGYKLEDIFEIQKVFRHQAPLAS